MNNRRKLVIALGAGALAGAGAARAQALAKVPRIGLLSPFSPSDAAPWHHAFRLGLRDLGWVEGKNISIEYRYAEGKSDRIPDLAADLVRLKVDVIVASVSYRCFGRPKSYQGNPYRYGVCGGPCRNWAG